MGWLYVSTVDDGVQLFVQCASSLGLNGASAAAAAAAPDNAPSSSSASSTAESPRDAGALASCSTPTLAAGGMYGTTAAAAAGLLAYPRVAAFSATSDYATYAQPYVPFDSSAFYAPLVTASSYYYYYC